MDKRIEKLDSSCIFQANNQTVSKPRTENYYTIAGSEDFKDDEFNPRLNVENNQTYAKSIYIPDNNSTRYYVKLDSRGKLFNPMSKFNESVSQNFINRVCKENTKFQDVNPKIFSMYLRFLRTKNESWLNNAEREMI
jgi:hypothetical protein